MLALAQMALLRLPDSAARMPQCRTIPRWQLQQGIPARELRQGAYKQQLRDHEEAELELVRAMQVAQSSVNAYGRGWGCG